ncbi:hypothetical protein HDU84_001825 [Entophlyctis sp. JEL0112]|nr:hypothetical protein HDU84_001825 [Entophlyctis sp. JEL0112]
MASSSSAQIAQYGKKFPILLRTPSPKAQVELIETVGKGNYGYVYKGRLISSNEIAAVKVVFLKEDELKETLLEMEILKACNHPNITRYMGLFLKGLDLWVSPSLNPFRACQIIKFHPIKICMEFCGGGALDSIYRAIKKPFTEDQIASIIYDSLVGLNYLHSQVALIHRDIKAGNLLLTENGELKLADFGVSAKLKSPSGTARTFIGTPYWMAPEVINCDPDGPNSKTASYDCKADIWSIGITAIEIADKNPPLSDIHPMRALHLIPNSNLGLSKPKNWSKVFVDFIAACLIKDPTKRPSAQEILQHPFMTKAAGLPRQKIMQELVQKARSAKERKKAGLDVVDDEEDEVEKKQAVPDKVIQEVKTLAKTNAARQAEQQQQPKKEEAQQQSSAQQQLVVAAPLPNEVIKPSMIGSDFPGFIEDGNVSNRVLTPYLLTGAMRDLLGADILDHKFVLIGTERGLFFNELNTPRIEPIPLIRNIRFKQIQVLTDYNCLIALSGKHNHIRQYKLSSIRKLIYYLLGVNPAQLARSNMDSAESTPDGFDGAPVEDDEYRVLNDANIVEDEATLIAKWTNDYIKILATKDSSSFLIQRTESSIYMAALFARDIILFEWAKDPYLRFMKLKAFWLPEAPKAMNLITDGLTVREVYMAYAAEANLVQVSDSKVVEVNVHREFARNAAANPYPSTKARWRSFNQIPFSDAKRSELKSLSRPNSTVNRKLVAVTGAGNIATAVVDRYFLATYHRLTRVVDIWSQPMMGSGVGGWKDGVTWTEPPNQIVMRPVDQVIAVGRQCIEVADWRSAQLLQTLRVDASASIRVLNDYPGSFLTVIDQGRRGSVLYHMKEKQKDQEKTGEVTSTPAVRQDTGDVANSKTSRISSTEQLASSLSALALSTQQQQQQQQQQTSRPLPQAPGAVAQSPVLPAYQSMQSRSPSHSSTKQQHAPRPHTGATASNVHSPVDYAAAQPLAPPAVPVPQPRSPGAPDHPPLRSRPPSGPMQVPPDMYGGVPARPTSAASQHAAYMPAAPPSGMGYGPAGVPPQQASTAGGAQPAGMQYDPRYAAYYAQQQYQQYYAQQQQQQMYMQQQQQQQQQQLGQAAYDPRYVQQMQYDPRYYQQYYAAANGAPPPNTQSSANSRRGSGSQR